MRLPAEHVPAPAAFPGYPVHADTRVGDGVSLHAAGPNPQAVKKTITAVGPDRVRVLKERDDPIPPFEHAFAKEGAAPVPNDKAEEPKTGDLPAVSRNCLRLSPPSSGIIDKPANHLLGLIDEGQPFQWPDACQEKPCEKNQPVPIVNPDPTPTLTGVGS
jgi:hypothetical protein